MSNADVAIEAVFNTWPESDRTQPVSITFGDEPTDRRCWAAAISPETDTFYLDLNVPATLDADVYIYRANFVDGDPELVARALKPELGDDESLAFVPEPGVQCSTN